jgi:hypothetical protein
VDESTRNLLRAADEAVSRLVEACRKDGALYPRDPRAVAQVSRTGKWHLNAITALSKALDAPCADSGKQAS